MVDLNNLSPEALKQAMTHGTASWGQWGSIRDHGLYAQALQPKYARRKCHCGCGGKAKFGAFANGVCMSSGCELSIRRYVKRVNENLALTASQTD